MMDRTIEELAGDLDSGMASLERRLSDDAYKDIQKEFDAGLRNMVLYGCECYQFDSFNRLTLVPLAFILE